MPDLPDVPALPRYRCHKIVRAAKITGIVPFETGSVALHFDVDPSGYASVVSPMWMQKHTPEVGGYFVRYDDGYESFSPAPAFEAGYTRLPDAVFESPDPMLQFFSYAHLPEPLRVVSHLFADLAIRIAAEVPRNPERTVALRRLLEAKDCAVRAVLYKA